jgi:hypothetical protein
MAETPYSQHPWPGYSTTAGTNYDQSNAEIPTNNLPVNTGIVPIGGIPLLDSLIRPELYQNGNTPATMNAQTVTNLQNSGVNTTSFNGDYADTANSPSKQAAGLVPTSGTDGQVPPTNEQGGQPTETILATPVPGGGDLGIVATPGG